VRKRLKRHRQGVGHEDRNSARIDCPRWIQSPRSSATSAPDPIPRAPMERSNASSSPPCATGPTPNPA